MKILAGIFCVMLMVSGCAAYRQARTDVSTGLTAPLVPDEVSPSEQAHGLTDPLEPFLPQAGALAGLLTVFFAYSRGRRIRKGKAAVLHPITGKVGNLEWLVQRGSDIFAGMFEVGPDGSALKRGWKAALATGLASGILTIPQINHVVGNNEAVLAATVAVITGLIAAGEKKLSIVLPTIDPAGGTV